MRTTASRVYMRPQPVPKMPPGMVELMEGLTRDVLKYNPPDVYGFCANHMQKLLDIRDGPVPKRPLTLEEKIARAQQKIRERAEQRKRQYDKEMKLRSGKKNTKSKDENSQENITKTSIEEIETQIISDPVAESSLKAPVHHEHELRDALEVEIYHKPSEDLQTEKQATEDFTRADNEETIADESRASEEQNNENQASKEQLVTTYNDSTMSETDRFREKDTFSGVDENEIENPVENQFQIRKPRSAEAENAGENVKEIHKEIEHESLIIQTQSTESVAPNDLPEAKEGFEDQSLDNIDYTQTVIHESVNESEKNHQKQSNQKELENATNVDVIELPKDEIQDANFNEVTGCIIKDTDVDQEQNEEEKVPETDNIDIVKVDMKESEKKEPTNVTLPEGEISITAKTTSNEKSNVVNNTANENVSDDVDKPDVNGNEKSQEHHENTSNSKVDIAENHDPPEVETEVQNETIMGSKEVNEYTEDENNSVEFPHNKDVKGEIEETKHYLEPYIDKEPKDTSDSIHTNNSDGTISEHRVVVVELPEVKDDNASVPEPNIVDNSKPTGNECNLTDTPVNITNEDTDNDFLSASETDSEKPDTDQLSKDIEQIIHERSKRNLENICEGIETSSNTTDVGKSDNETASLGKFSSMDDSAPEDGNDNIGNEIMTNDKSANYINTGAMDLETAAVTIQKVFRTFLFKSRASTFGDSVNDDNNLTDEDTEKVDIDLLVPPTTNLKERRGIGRMDTVLQTVNEEKSLSLSTDDSSLSSAATVIQAHVRGFLVRSKLNSNKTASLVNSDGHSTSFEAELDQNKPNKTVLNIIVPEGGHFLSRDESALTSMDLSLDGSPPSSVNLHPLGYDKSEPRKQLKRGDAIQSISPPSNNSGKLSEDIDSMKEVLNDDSTQQQKLVGSLVDDIKEDMDANSRDTTPTRSTTVETVVEAHKLTKETTSSDDKMSNNGACRGTLTKMSSDESDVVTPFEEKNLTDSDNTLGLLHSGEFHDVVLPTKISRSDASVVREFKNVLAYFLIWNHT